MLSSHYLVKILGTRNCHAQEVSKQSGMKDSKLSCNIQPFKIIFVWILITYIEDFTFNCTYSRVLFVCCIFIALVLSNLSLFYFFVIACLCLAACIGEINFLISAAKWPVRKEPSLHISGCRTEVGPDLGGDHSY